MRSFVVAAALAAFAVKETVGHAIFQDLWVHGQDEGTTCARFPPSNSPVQDVTSNNIRCNVNGANGVAKKCTIAAGKKVTIEMHQQPGDRSCKDQAISPTHLGPVNVYMTKVSDATTADGSSGWFKIFADSWAPGNGRDGSSDYWGTLDLVNCCGRMNVKIPADIPAGDYLLRAEALALHAAQPAGGAQFYITCYQLTVTGGGSAKPDTVLFPGAYKASDPGIEINIYEKLSTYVNPGPTVYSGGSTRSAGAPCKGVEATGTINPAMPSMAQPAVAAGGSSSGSGSGSGSGGCTVAQYGQCGGQGYQGCTTCASPYTCKVLSSGYSQCS